MWGQGLGTCGDGAWEWGLGTCGDVWGCVDLGARVGEGGKERKEEGPTICFFPSPLPFLLWDERVGSAEVNNNCHLVT